jgi:16S rRNA processing protein RimM
MNMVDYLKVGQIINTHGVKGEVKIYPLTDDVKRFDNLKFVYMKSGEEYKKVDVESVKYVKNFPIIKLSNINDMNEAERYKNQYIYVDRENAVKLPEDTYFIVDLIGMDVITVDGENLGKIVSVFSTGSNDVYEVKQESGKVVLIPAIKDVVKEVDVENKKMIIKLLEGLI